MKASGVWGKSCESNRCDAKLSNNLINELLSFAISFWCKRQFARKQSSEATNSSECDFSSPSALTSD